MATRTWASVTSKATVMSTKDRVDPYWAEMWDVTNTARWSTRRAIERRVVQGTEKRPTWMNKSEEQYLDDIAWGRRSTLRQKGLAATNMFRTVTSEHLATITGNLGFSSWNNGYDRTCLLGSGLVQKGYLHTDAVGNRMPWLLRPSVDSTLDNLQERLPWSTLVGITNGNKWKTGVAADRHNVIITELLLRIAEHCDVPLVIGEQLCDMKLLATDGMQIPKTSNRAGDGLVFRQDGMRIVIELTASLSSNFESKVEKWNQFLVDDKSRSTTVIFVEAPHPDRANFTSSQLKGAIVNATKGMESSLNDVTSRMMYANWQDWFPAPGMVDDSFFSLRCQRPTGAKDDRWEDVDVLDPFDLELDYAIKDKPLLDNVGFLYGVPHWMREEQPFDLQRTHLLSA